MNVSVLLIMTSPKLYSQFQKLLMSPELCDMLPGPTLFGVVLVLIIVGFLAFLLIRKPSFSFGEISAETTKPETKSRKSRGGTKKGSEKCPNYLGYLREIPKNTRTPNECLTCTRMMECQGLNAFRREEASRKKPEITQTLRGPVEPPEQVEPQTLRGSVEPPEQVEPQTLRGSVEPPEQVEPQEIIEERQVAAALKKHGKERPSRCLHFFGYLRNMPKNTLIPDECLGCTKMVECLYHSILE